MNCIFHRSPLAGLMLACALFARTAAADEEPAATPYRPTVSNPADLSAPGWLEIETGVQRDKGSDARTVSVPYLLKYAFTPDWGVLVGGDAYLRNTAADGTTASGFGDTQFLVKHRREVAEGRAFGFEAGVRAPTAKAALGSGMTDYLFNGIFSTDLGAAHLDVNVGPTWVGRRDPGTGRIEWNAAAALSTAIAEGWNIAGELSGTRRQGEANQSQFLMAVAWSASKRTVFDAGFVRGIGDSSLKWSAFAGVTMLVGQLR